MLMLDILHIIDHFGYLKLVTIVTCCGKLLKFWKSFVFRIFVERPAQDVVEHIYVSNMKGSLFGR
jgi:hypothetical protein